MRGSPTHEEVREHVCELWWCFSDRHPRESMGNRVNRIQERVGIHARTIRDILVREGCYGPRKRRLPDELKREFQKGVVYRFWSRRAQGPTSTYARDADHMKIPDSMCEGRFGVNWLFRTPAGWSFCLTDVQASLDYETEVSSWT